MRENLEKFIDFLENLHCPKCGANSHQIVIDKNFKNRVFFLRCLRCNSLFCLYDTILKEEEAEFLKGSGYFLEPLPELDFKNERKISYVR